MGFFYKVFLSHTIGASGLGLYQLIFPIFTLCLAISTSGIQTSITRYVAMEQAKGRSGRIYLAHGLLVSTSLSLILMLFIRGCAPWLAGNILMEPKTSKLLVVMSYCLIPASVHACINGYYFGKKSPAIPSLCQITEQVARVGGTYLIYQVLLEKELPLMAIHAVWGLLISEFMGLLLSSTAFILHNMDPSMKHTKVLLQKPSLYPLIATAVPLTLNHVLMTLSGSLEHLLIPKQLISFGYNSQEALSHFGILSGMAMSMIMAPAVLTGSLSVLLLPRISEAQARGDRTLIIDTIKGAVSCGITLGSLCTFLFLFSADWIGTTLFDNSLAGFYIQILSVLCPFLYSCGVLNSILSGLGHTGWALTCNLFGCFIRIIGIWFFMPAFGMYAYIIALVISYILTMAGLIYVVYIKTRT